MKPRDPQPVESTTALNTQPSQTISITPQKSHGICPNCGRCPHCGHVPNAFWQYQTYPPIWYSSGLQQQTAQAGATFNGFAYQN